VPQEAQQLFQSNKMENKNKKTNEQIAVLRTTLPVSRKDSAYILKFIDGKKIEDAIKSLEEVIKFKAAVPMKGEIPHRKGMMSGRYPIKAAEMFIKLLRGLAGNASQKENSENGTVHGRTNKAPKAVRPGRFRHKFKRVHVEIVLEKK
jgi:ribosomal protein L22